MSILAVYNIKGGVGKSTAAVNLACLSARSRGPTLLCDLDPQGSSSFALRIDPAKKLTAKKLLEGGGNITGSIEATDYSGLDVLPASFSYRNLDLKLSAGKRPKHRFEKILRPLRKRYVNIFLDCPPGITLESENVFHAARLMLLPFVPSPLSLVTYERLLRFLAAKRFDPSRVTAFFSMVDRRKKLHREMIEELLRSDPRFLDVEIPYSAEIERMGRQRKPVVASHPGSRGGRAFLLLWQAIEKRLEASPAPLP